MLRRLFWVVVPLLFVAAIFGAAVGGISGTNGTTRGIVEDTAAVIGAVLYLAFWRLKWTVDVGAPFFESRSARKRRQASQREADFRRLQTMFADEIAAIEKKTIAATDEPRVQGPSDRPTWF